MTLAETLQDDLKTAMKSGDVIARQSLRMVIAALKNLRIEKGDDLEDAEVIAVIGKEVKKRQDSDEQYTTHGREDLAEIERAEIKVLERYLPKQLSEDETRTIVGAAIDKLGLTSKKEMGQVMKAVMADHRGEVDGKLVQRLAGELLG